MSPKLINNVCDLSHYISNWCKDGMPGMLNGLYSRDNHRLFALMMLQALRLDTLVHARCHRPTVVCKRMIGLGVAMTGQASFLNAMDWSYRLSTDEE